MTTFLYSILLTTGAERMAVNDPHGWTLTVISVCVVFCALAILYCVYRLSGDIFSGKFKKASAAKADEAVQAAIATAVHLYLSGQMPTDDGEVHDIEPGILTIRRSEGGGWTNKALNFRKLPK